MDISVVIPLYNEEESLTELHSWIQRVMKANNFSYEIIFINDGSTDRSWDVIMELQKSDPQVHGIKFRRNYGKSAALYCGFKRAEGDVVITMDADLQDSPDEIPEMYRMVKKEGYDLVSGYKQKRYDPLSKTLPTKLFNATARKVSGIRNLHDFNCGLKAYRKDVVKNIEVYGEMHRYIPYLAKQKGFDKIGEKVVHHRARKYGSTKFGGLNRFFNGYLDVRTQAHARVRFLRHSDVLYRIYSHPGRRRNKISGTCPRHSRTSCDTKSLLLHRTDDDDTRNSTVPYLILGRTHQQTGFQPQRLPDRA